MNEEWGHVEYTRVEEGTWKQILLTYIAYMYAMDKKINNKFFLNFII